jgi:hypothetical protein
LEVLLRGVFDRRRFLDLIRYGVVFDRHSADGLVAGVGGNPRIQALDGIPQADRIHP